MYFIIETQAAEGGTGAAIVTTKSTRNEAEAEYHRVLQAAAVSGVYKHGAVILTEDCMPLMPKCYEHGGEEE